MRIANKAFRAHDGARQHDAGQRSCGIDGGNTMANDPNWNFDVPTQMRQFAEQSVEQARKAVDGFMTAAQKAVTTMETQADTAKTGVKDVGQKAMGFAEQNITNSFEFAQKLVRAKDIQEVMALQQEYLQLQMKAMSEQAKDLGTHATKMAMDSAKPKT
jgi:phasin